MRSTPSDGPAATDDFRLDRDSMRVAATTIGPVRIGGVHVALRPPRLGDGPAWRTTMLAEERWLRPAFGSPTESWRTTSSLTSWADRVSHQRAAARAGSLIPYVLAHHDGRISGEVSFAIDPRTAAAELSIWLAHDTPKVVRSWMFGMALMRVFGLPQQISRILAPVAVTNPAPSGMFQALGFTHQAVCRDLRLYDGARVDHDLWWLEPSDDLVAAAGRVLLSYQAT